MKKLKIAGVGVAALGFAAMPILGVFAATSTLTDTVTVTLADACALTSSQTSGAVGDGTHTDNTYTLNLQNGQSGTVGSSTTGQAGGVVNVVCNNNNSTWTLTAVGGDGTTANTNMVASGIGGNIATGLATSGDASSWAMKVTGATAASGYNAFKEVPGTAVTLATGTGSSPAAFSMEYQVYIGDTQPSDTYTGKVTYTLTSVNP